MAGSLAPQKGDAPVRQPPRRGVAENLIRIFDGRTGHDYIGLGPVRSSRTMLESDDTRRILRGAVGVTVPDGGGPMTVNRFKCPWLFVLVLAWGVAGSPTA